MKLTNELKNKIDRYFNNISATELFKIAVQKHGFTINPKKDEKD